MPQETGEKRQTTTKELKKGLQKIDDPIIHTMPKRFINAKESTAEGHKGIGLLIFGLGGIFMIAAIVFIYFFVFNSSEKSPPSSPSEAENGIIEDRAEDNRDKGLEGEADLQNKNNNSGPEDEDEEGKGSAAEDEQEAAEDEQEEPGETKIIEDAEDVPEESATSAKKVINTAPVQKKREFLPAPDADKDGLFDLEEALFGTNSKNSDTDQDGFSDLNELKNLYNPAGSGKLIVNSGIKKFSNNSKVYSLYYPGAWEPNQIGEGESVIFKIDNEQFIQVIFTKLLDAKTLEDWYKEQFGVNIVPADRVVYKKGWNGIKNEEGLIYYLSKPDSPLIFTVNYNTQESVLFYFNVFEMIINSLELE